MRCTLDRLRAVRVGVWPEGTLIVLVLVLAKAGMAQAPATEKTVATPPMARFVPAKDLVFYAEFSGLEGHERPWRRSAMYKILNETTFGALLEDLAAQGIRKLRKQEVAADPTGSKAVAEIEQVARRGFVFALLGKPPARPLAVIVVRGGADPGLQPILDALLTSLSGPKGDQKEVVRKAGRAIVVRGVGVAAGAMWNEKGDTVLCDIDAVDAVLGVLDGKGPNAVDNPLRVKLAAIEAGFEPLAIAFAELKSLGPIPPDVARLGLGGVERIDARWGFQDDAMISIVRLAAPAPRQGVLALLDQPTFDKSSLPPLPASLTDFTALSFDPAKTYDRVVALNKAEAGDGARKFAEAEAKLRETLGIDLRKDLLAHIGPKLAFYAEPLEGGPAAQMLSFLNQIITVQIDDSAAVARALGPIVDLVNRELAKPNPQRPRAGPAPEFVKLDGPRVAYRLVLPPGTLPPGPLGSLDPTVMVGKDQFVIAARRELAESALALAEGKGKRWDPVGPFAPLARHLPSDLVFLNVNDPRQTFPTLVAQLPLMLQAMNAAITQAAAANPGAGAAARRGLPIQIDPNLVPLPGDLARLLFPGSLAVAVDDQGLKIVSRSAFPSVSSPAGVGVAVGLLLPAVQAAREAARRAQCVNNLKQIGLALQNYHDLHGHFPKPAITDKAGKPLLSWRVEILPLINGQALYDKFHHDEPWDSPHNLGLLESMPTTFACPSAPVRAPGRTSYRAIAGDGAFWDPKKAVSVADITDGTSLTLAVVEANESVPWTRPDDLPFDPKIADRFLGAGSRHPGGFNVLFVDGSVKFFKLSLDPTLFRALITRSGGEDVQVP